MLLQLALLTSCLFPMRAAVRVEAHARQLQWMHDWPDRNRRRIVAPSCFMPVRSPVIRRQGRFDSCETRSCGAFQGILSLLHLPHARVAAALGDQFIVRAPLDYLAALEDDDLIGFDDR